MFYTYNKEELKFEKAIHVNSLKWVLIGLALMSFISVNTMEIKDYEHILEINISGEREFTEDKLVRKLKELNIRYPHIVLAQAKLESNNYSSRIFIDNNNLFGMKEARVRINLAKGTQYKHAYYNTWQESVLDYAFWMATYGSKCKTEQQYYNLLNGYAEDSNYQAKLKNIIKKNNLKSKFN
jgi:uncharacterized FlgJ-related protein